MAFKMKGHTLPGINQRGYKDMKDGKSKTSAFQQYGTRPGERMGGKASAKADMRRKAVDSRRGVTGLSSGEKVKIPTLFGKSTQGKNVGGEYKMGLADYKVFGGMGKKNLRARGLALEGDHQKHIDKKRKKKKRQIKRGAKFDNYGDRIN